jgi:hypothetical protein
MDRPLLERVSWVAGIVSVVLAIVWHSPPRSAHDGPEPKNTVPERQVPDEHIPKARPPVAVEPPQHHPSGADLVQLQSEFDQALREIAASSAWRCPPTLGAIIKGQPVMVFFSQPRLQEAAKAVYRLRVAGAIVTYRPVAAEGDAPKHNEMLYHWSRLQVAQSIQEILQDIEFIDIKRDDQAGSPQLWIS